MTYYQSYYTIIILKTIGYLPPETSICMTESGLVHFFSTFILYLSEGNFIIIFFYFFSVEKLMYIQCLI